MDQDKEKLEDIEEEILSNEKITEDENVEKETKESVKGKIAEENIDEEDEYIQSLEKDIENQKKKADEYYDSLMRNMAEFDNYKKRIAKEKDNMYLMIVSDVIASILPLADNIEKAINSECQDEKYKEGIELIYKDFMAMLKKYNIEQIEDVGATFDPMLHEAVMCVEDNTKGEKEIIEVFRKGYRLGDKIVRHSLVKVAN